MSDMRKSFRTCNRLETQAFAALSRAVARRDRGSREMTVTCTRHRGATRNRRRIYDQTGPPANTARKTCQDLFLHHRSLRENLKRTNASARSFVPSTDEDSITLS